MPVAASTRLLGELRVVVVQVADGDVGQARVLLGRVAERDDRQRDARLHGDLGSERQRAVRFLAAVEDQNQLARPREAGRGEQHRLGHVPRDRPGNPADARLGMGRAIFAQRQQVDRLRLRADLVEGEPDLDADVINAPLASHSRIKDKYMVPGMRQRTELFKEAVTRYEVAERFKGFALMHLHPKTGRTHQLRVHMSYIGHPMLGDTFYGGHLFSEKDVTGQGSEDPLIASQALHAHRIRFRHPIREEMMEIEAPPNPQLARIIDMLRTYRKRG